MSSIGMDLLQGFAQSTELKAQAKLATMQARAVGQQTVAAEEAQRRSARDFLATQSAAIGESGIGYGGSSAEVMRQSAIDAELDALNIRYEGQVKQQGLKTEAKLAKRGARAAVILGAGKALSRGGELALLA